MEYPVITVNLPAVLTAGLAIFAVGGIWYGPLFGPLWGRLLGLDFSTSPTRAFMIRAFTMEAVVSIFTAYVAVHTILVWMPSVWGQSGDHAPWVYAVFNALFITLGY